MKNGFLVELQPDGKRKQRHCFLFTDLIVCTKYKGNAGNLEIKWYLPLAQVSVSTDDSAAKLNVSALTNVASLRLVHTEKYPETGPCVGYCRLHRLWFLTKHFLGIFLTKISLALLN